MKEAAGEANMTVITIVLIAIVLGVGTLVVNNLLKNVSKRSVCTSAGGSKIIQNGTDKYICQDDNKNTICYVKVENGQWVCSP